MNVIAYFSNSNIVAYFWGKVKCYTNFSTDKVSLSIGLGMNIIRMFMHNFAVVMGEIQEIGKEKRHRSEWVKKHWKKSEITRRFLQNSLDKSSKVMYNIRVL